MCDHCGCRSFPAIAELTAEHDEILALAWDVTEALRAGKPAALERARLLDLLDLHVEKEETGLYPQLGDSGDLGGAQRDALEAEHREVRAWLSAGTFDRREYFALAAHIEEEEMELFPAAMFAFDDDGWDELTRAHEAAVR